MFLNGFIFKEQIGWRHHGYKFLNNEICYFVNIHCNNIWNILAMMIINKYIFITSIKESYFKTFDVLNWFKTRFLLALRRDGKKCVVYFDATGLDSWKYLYF